MIMVSFRRTRRRERKVLIYICDEELFKTLQVIPPNAGRDAVPVFLKRSKLPKDPGSLPQPGVETDRTVLNVFGPTGAGGRYILDSLKVKEWRYKVLLERVLRCISDLFIFLTFKCIVFYPLCLFSLCLCLSVCLSFYPCIAAFLNILEILSNLAAFQCFFFTHYPDKFLPHLTIIRTCLGTVKKSTSSTLYLCSPPPPPHLSQFPRLELWTMSITQTKICH